MSGNANASCEGASTLTFDKYGYVKLPSGMIADGSNFTIQILASAPKQSNHWLLTLGTKEGKWPNVDNYFFVTPNSAQNGYEGKLLAAISQGGETRLPAAAEALPMGYSDITIVSQDKHISVYTNGVKTTELEHTKDWDAILGSEDFIGYLGKSLYTPDPLLEGRIASFKVWDTALNDKELQNVFASADEKTAALKADLLKALLKDNKAADKIDSDLNLVSEMDGLTIAWTIEENTAVGADGTYTPPAAEVPFKATAALEDGSSIVFDLKAPSENITEILAEAAAQIEIPNASDIRGNITLPKSAGRCEVSWSVDEAGAGIVDLQEKAAETGEDGNLYAMIPAGVITRPDQDTSLVLKATIRYKDGILEKEIPITVKAKAEQKELTDYFFAYFTGEGKANGEQIYFSASEDGLFWTDLNNGEPSLLSTLGEKGVRDPYLIRSYEGDRFYLIATDLKINGGNGWDAAQTAGSQSLLVWQSDDLIHWSEPRLVPVSEKLDAGCTWAPEAFYDAKTGEYVVFWSSKVKEDSYAKQRVYYAKTRDFAAFSDPQLWIEKDQSTIDTTVIEQEGTYYRLSKNEGGSTNELGAKTKTLFLEASDSLLGSYHSIPSESLNANQYVEGPAIFKLNANDSEADSWILLADDFGGRGYYPLQTASLASGEFTALESGSYKMPAGARHGTPIAISSDEYDAIMKAMGSPETAAAAVCPNEAPMLPETVKTGRSEEAVTWNLDGYSQPARLFERTSVSGTTESGKTAEASVQLFPKDLEYFVDCNNPNSQTYQKAKTLYPALINQDSTDQPKTETNLWGSVSSIGGVKNEFDMCPFSMNSPADPYEGGYWASDNRTMDYAFTLPAGDHTISIGNKGWWNMGRTMAVYAITSAGTVKLADCDAASNSNRSASGTIHLDQEETITVSVRTTGSEDPILSWIAISGQAQTDKSALQEEYEQASKLNAADYSNDSFAGLSAILLQVKDVLENEQASLYQVREAQTALQQALNGLVRVTTITFKTNKEGYINNSTVDIVHRNIEEGKTVSVPKVSGADGSTFLHWIDENGSPVELGETVTAGKANQTYTAIFEAKSITITWKVRDPNGASISLPKELYKQTGLQQNADGTITYTGTKKDTVNNKKIYFPDVTINDGYEAMTGTARKKSHWLKNGTGSEIRWTEMTWSPSDDGIFFELVIVPVQKINAKVVYKAIDTGEILKECSRDVSFGTPLNTETYFGSQVDAALEGTEYIRKDGQKNLSVVYDEANTVVLKNQAGEVIQTAEKDGNKYTISVLVPRKEAVKTTITFKTNKEGYINNSTVDIVHREVEEGSAVSVPAVSGADGSMFLHWIDENGNPVELGETVTAGLTDQTYTAIFEAKSITITWKVRDPNGASISLPKELYKQTGLQQNADGTITYTGTKKDTVNSNRIYFPDITINDGYEAMTGTAQKKSHWLKNGNGSEIRWTEMTWSADADGTFFELVTVPVQKINVKVIYKAIDTGEVLQECSCDVSFGSPLNTEMYFGRQVDAALEETNYVRKDEHKNLSVVYDEANLVVLKNQAGEVIQTAEKDGSKYTFNLLLPRVIRTTITFKTSEGGRINNGEEDVVFEKMEKGESAAVPAVLAKEGYIFKHWMDAQGNAAALGESVIAGDEDQAYTAVFEKQLPAADKIALQKRVDEISKESLKQEDYDETSWNALDQAMELANTVLADETADQKAVDSALNALNKAREDLIRLYSIVFKADGTAVHTVKAKDGSNASDLLPEEPVKDGYLFKGWTPEPGLIHSDMVYVAIFEAIPAPVIHTELLEAAVNKTEKTDLADYSPAGKEQLAESLKKAKAVLEKPISQEKVDDAAKDLHNALLDIRCSATPEILAKALKHIAEK